MNGGGIQLHGEKNLGILVWMENWIVAEKFIFLAIYETYIRF